MRERLPKPARLPKAADFRRVYAARTTIGAGPLVCHAAPNGTARCRLGLSVPRRVGTAVRRNLIKRRLREAFRRVRHDVPAGYDLVINVRPHEPLPFAEYQRLLSRALRGLHRRCTEHPRPARSSRTDPSA